LHVETPQVDDLWQDLIDREGVKSVQPVFRRVGYLRVGVLRHYIGDVFEHLKAQKIQPGVVLVISFDGFLQRTQALIDVPLELDPVNTRDDRRGPEFDRLSIDLDCFTNGSRGFSSTHTAVVVTALLRFREVCESF